VLNSKDNPDTEILPIDAVDCTASKLPDAICTLPLLCHHRAGFVPETKNTTDVNCKGIEIDNKCTGIHNQPTYKGCTSQAYIRSFPNNEKAGNEMSRNLKAFGEDSSTTQTLTKSVVNSDRKHSPPKLALQPKAKFDNLNSQSGQFDQVGGISEAVAGYTKTLSGVTSSNVVNKNLQAGTAVFTEEKLAGQSLQSRTTNTSTKHLPPSLGAATAGVGVTNDPLTVQDQASEATGYTTSTLPGATGSHSQNYGTDFDKDQPLSREERNHMRTGHKAGSLQSHQNLLTSTKKLQSLQHKTTTASKQLSKPAVTLSTSNKPKGTFPRRACLVYNKEQYPLDRHLLSQPLATKYLVKVRTEISPGRFMAKLDLHCARYVIHYKTKRYYISNIICHLGKQIECPLW